MRKILIWSLLSSMIVSLAAPYGAVFALDEPEEMQGIELASSLETADRLSEALAAPSLENHPLDAAVEEEVAVDDQSSGGDAVDIAPAFRVSNTSQVESLLISKVITGPSKEEAVEIYNNSDQSVVLSGVRLVYFSKDSVAESLPRYVLYSFSDDLTIATRDSLVLANYHSGIRADLAFDVKNKDGQSYTNSSLLLKDGTVVLSFEGTVIDLVGLGDTIQYEARPIANNDKEAWQRCLDIAGRMVDTDSNFDDFAIYDSLAYGQFVSCPEERVNGYDSSPPEAPGGDDGPSRNLCAGVVISEIGANLPGVEQFIELLNTTGSPVSLDGCQLTTNRSKVKKFLFTNQQVSAGGYIVVLVADAELLLTKTSSGTVYLLDEESVEIDEVAYHGLPAETSWSLIDGAWAVTYQTTPGRPNVLQRYASCDNGYFRNESTGRCNKIIDMAAVQPCRTDQYRSEETGRCRNIETAKLMTPCKEGQYRSELTNRCRSIAVVANTLKPCTEDQFRNPETNRCKKIASQDDLALADCGEGRERNPSTNRCRNVLSSAVPKAGFAPEKVKAVQQGMIGWWAFGGMSLVAVSYAAWQWRFEMRKLMERIKTSFAGRQK